MFAVIFNPNVRDLTPILDALNETINLAKVLYDQRSEYKTNLIKNEITNVHDETVALAAIFHYVTNIFTFLAFS